MPLAAPVRPLLGLLREMHRTIDRLDDARYAAPAPGRTSGGVGSHVRHCLDHVSALLSATRTGVCAYDRRRRDTDVESSRGAAMARIADVATLLACFDPICLDDPILVESQLEPSGAMILTRSTVSRELVFVISHTIHHNAIIGQMLAAEGIALEPRYGIAPSTPDDLGTPPALARMSLSCAP